MFICEKCGKAMSVRGKNKVYCSNCQRTDSTKWFCMECLEETGIRFFVEVLADGSLLCNRCGRKDPNPDLSQKPPKKSKTINLTISQEPYSEVLEDLRCVVFIGLPISEGQIPWEYENGVLKVKISRFDFQYEKVIEIPPEWRNREPEVRFLNGTLSFSW